MRVDTADIECIHFSRDNYLKITDIGFYNGTSVKPFHAVASDLITAKRIKNLMMFN